jgi:phytoene desaturase
VTGVELSGGGWLAARTVVSNVDVPTTQGSLLRAKKVKVPRMTPGVVTFYWGIRGRLDPLGHHTIFLPDDVRDGFLDLFQRQRIPRELPFYISIASDTDSSLAPPGHSTVFALVPTPLLSELGPIDWSDTVSSLRGILFERLRQHGVALDEERVVCEEVLTPADWGERFGLYDGSAFGAAHTLFQLGPFRTQNVEPSVEGLYYVGAGTTPGTGLPMVTLGAFMTAERVLRDAR